MSRAMGGSCSMPLAAFITQCSGDEMQLSAAWGDPVMAEAEASEPVSTALPAALVEVRQSAVVNSFASAEALGDAVAAQLRAGGAVWAGNAQVV